MPENLASYVNSDEIAEDAVGSNEIDLSAAFEWLERHQFNDGLDTRGDIVADDVQIWDSESEHVAQDALENDSATIAGTEVTLGEDAEIEYSALADREHGMDDHDGSVASSDDLSDLDESKIDSAEKGSEDGVAELDSNALVREGQIPSLAITDVEVFEDEDELENWEEAEQGDVGIVRDDDDNGVSYMLTTDDPTEFENWQRLKAPRPPVDDVFGRTGSVDPQEEDYEEYYYGEGDDPKFGDSTVEGIILEDTSVND